MKSSLAWLKQWARTAVQAATRVEFYREASSRRTGEAVGHLAMLAVVWTLPLTVMFFSGLREVTARLAAGLRDDIPAGTVFEMKDGRLSNNLAEPLVYRAEDGAIIVNTASSTLGLKEGEDGIVIGAEGVEQRDGDRVETLSYADAPDFSVSRETLMKKISRWGPLALFLASLFVLVFMFLTFWSGILLNALLHGFALWLLLKVIRRERKWREAFVLGAYAATAPALLKMAFQGIGGWPAALPDVAYWAFIAWIAYDAYRRGAAVPPKGGSHERKEEAAVDRPHGDRRDPA